MKAIRLYGKEKIQLDEVTKPQISENEVLLKVKAASLCGTDVRMYKNGHAGVDENHPLTLGHEIAGIITEVGSKITSYKVGQRVAVAPNIGCGNCDQCVSGNTHLCANYQAFGINLAGGFAEYLKIPTSTVQQGNITPLADETTFEQAALIEPFSCVFNGQNIASVYSGDTVLIIGGGPIGIMHAMLAFSKGASQVILTDHHKSRMEAAKEILPELTVVTGENLANKIVEKTNNHGVDLCIVAAPSPQAQTESLQYMAINGRLLFFGGLPKGSENVPLNTNILHYKQLRIFGCTRASLSSYRTSEKLIASGQVPIERLITNKYPLEEFEQALKNAENSIGLKNVIVFE
ncbi:putative zinc-containing alcohol dehydrogenase [Tetragenococcus halophilus subsp. halophilus]|uniref:alcohol dehydrogenase catalytic domain-containing protein n=1 Tax=Tetragenococcus halophilus TaxID=51669 RepID=UPI000CAA208D|nr:alcohol dehydrogenase catalytic domain-containing protein [Tetragenococcus halophilus]MCO8287710.1 alcohol dehydrogenase catalytic domain-containing protein [Tetragenococcus halophilus]NWO01241.1 alcohol dehydrogenase catalytic domain-containing protein [Tetragenococcus halophilus]GBD81046.1 putative zinc-containing alcohol dehydrogenase [Tetragenococcus halophilus subsp. halophilus]GBD82103.1 putative zinc-containing alcohol dehydrogenase [Tetragenococcus halophilus subsp. halophilus]GFK24